MLRILALDMELRAMHYIAEDIDLIIIRSLASRCAYARRNRWRCDARRPDDSTYGALFAEISIQPQRQARAPMRSMII